MTDTVQRQQNGAANLPAIPAAPAMLPDADRAGRIMEAVIAAGDLADLPPAVRARYYVALCQSLGLNPMTQPFSYIKVQGKTILYPNKGCTDQLGRAHRVDVETVGRERFEDLWIVTVRARTPDGRSREEIGAVPIKGKTGEDLANALMKAATKATRRAILGLVGLGWLEPDRDAGDGEPVYADRHHNIARRDADPELVLPPATQSELDALATDDPPAANAQPVVREPTDDAEFVEEDADLLRAEMGEATVEPDATPFEQEQAPDDPLADKRATAEALYRRCIDAGLRAATVHPQATEIALEQATASYRRLLRAKGIDA